MMPVMMDAFKDMKRDAAYDRLFDAISCVDYTEFCIHPEDRTDVVQTSDGDVTRRDFDTKTPDGVGEPVGKMVHLDASDPEAFRRDFKEVLRANDGWSIGITESFAADDRYVHVKRDGASVDVGVSDFRNQPQAELYRYSSPEDEDEDDKASSWFDDMLKQSQAQNLNYSDEDFLRGLEDEDSDEKEAPEFPGGDRVKLPIFVPVYKAPSKDDDDYDYGDFC